MMTSLARPLGEPPERAQLASTVHASRLGSDLVLLDLASDEYMLVPDCGDVVIDGGTVWGPMALLLDLAAHEFLQSGSVTSSRAPPPALPTRSLPEPRDRRPSAADIATFGTLWAKAAMRKPTVQSLARQVSGRTGRRDDLDALASRMDLFRQMLPLAPAVGACLFQSELLLRFLNAGGLDADWVFGVRTWPFLAHCWLQVGDYCVSQAPETLAIYRPLMAI